MAFTIRQVTEGFWAEDIRNWKKKNYSPELAEALVAVMVKSFNALPAPAFESSYFGLHPDVISLTLGNIWLTAANRRSVWILIDYDIEADGCRNIWLKSANEELNLVAIAVRVLPDYLDDEKLWAAYNRSCEKIWDYPISRNFIARNNMNKTPLPKLL